MDWSSSFRIVFALLALASGRGWLCAAADEAQGPKVLPPTIVETNVWWQETPAIGGTSITELTGPQLERSGLQSLQELWRAVPNLAQSVGGQRSLGDTYLVRGLGNTQFLSDPAAVVYVDDAPFDDPIGYSTELLGIDHIEVYRGPQGTRFGRNAEAGVISIVTRQPSDHLDAEASASGGSYGTQAYRVSGQGPLVKGTLDFSLAGQYSSSDGFIRNTYLQTDADKTEALDGRASLSWNAAENWDVTFTLSGDKFDDGIGLVPLTGNPHQTTSDFDGKFDQTINGQSLRVRGEVSGLALTSVTTRREYDLNPWLFDLDFSPIPGNTGIVQQVQTVWTEELRLAPAVAGESWNWLAGFFFSTAETRLDRTSYLLLPPPTGSIFDVIDATKGAEDYAIFGECTRTFCEKLDITLGLRLDEAVRDLERTHVSTFGTVPLVTGESAFLNAAPKLGLLYRATERLSFYGDTGLGFKPGGYSELIDPPTSPKFETERVWASEVGLKSAWLGGKLVANAALFYNDVRDYQVEQFTPGGIDLLMVNAPRAYTLGGELELAARPSPGWELTSTFGYTDARLDRYTNPFTGVTVSDTHPPFAAEFNAAAAAQYEHRTGVFGRVEFIAVGDTYYDAENTAAFKQPAYCLLNARVGYERGHFGLFVFAENLTDKDYFTKKIPSLNVGAPGWPRTVGAKLVVRY